MNHNDQSGKGRQIAIDLLTNQFKEISIELTKYVLLNDKVSNPKNTLSKSEIDTAINTALSNEEGRESA